MTRIYLDYNATSPLTPKAKQAVLDSLDVFGNPSSVHQEGRKAKTLVQKARRNISQLVSAEPDNLIFTSGATEAAATLLTPHYVMGRTPLIMSHLYLGATEHPAVSKSSGFQSDQRTVLPVDTNGIVQPSLLEEQLAQHDKSKGLPLVAVQYANSETGAIQPIKKIAEITRNAGGFLIVDAVQAFGKIPINISADGADFFILSAHKIGGLKGIGAYVASGSLIRPRTLLAGGGQEWGLRGGTTPVQLISAFGAAAEDAQNNLQNSDHYKALQLKLEKGIQEICPNAIVFAKKSSRLNNTTYFTIPNTKAETLQIAFDLAGIAVSSGSACSSGKVGASEVLAAMGVESDEGALRISTGFKTHNSDIDYFFKVLQEIQAS